MSKSVVKKEEARRSVLFDMADRYGMEPTAFEAVVRATCLPPDKKTGRVATREEFAAFLLVAKEYGLNPLTKEIYAFLGKSGGIQPIVGVDGWSNIINSHPAFDGMEFEDHLDSPGGSLVAITCRMYRKDRTHAVGTTEYMDECRRPTEPWDKWPSRMLRHKAMIQAARYAFGFAGIVDHDEAERMAADLATDVTPRRLANVKEAFDEFAPIKQMPTHDLKTGELPQAPPANPMPADGQPAPTPDAEAPRQEGAGEALRDELDAALAAAAERGLEALQEEWETIHPSHQKILKPALERRHKPRAIEVDGQDQLL